MHPNYGGRLFHLLSRPPVHVTPEVSCEGKRGYPTWAEAERAVYETMEHNWDRGFPDRNSGLNAYHCRFCPLWHIGHSGSLFSAKASRRSPRVRLHR